MQLHSRGFEHHDLVVLGKERTDNTHTEIRYDRNDIHRRVECLGKLNRIIYGFVPRVGVP